jgi:DNA-binding PadR family transcriptional regulator
MNDPPLLVLLSLADGDKHGYGIQQDIEGFADERLGPGTLYGAIRRLEQTGFIEALPQEDRRRPYRITSSGRRAVAAEVARLDRLVERGRRSLRWT